MNYFTGDLQLALMAIGAVLILAVLLYNRFQEHRYKQRAERAFAPDRGDALFESAARAKPAAAEERIEPVLQDGAGSLPEPDPGPAEAAPGAPREPVMQAPTPTPAQDSGPLRLDYPVELHRERDFSPEELAPLWEALVPFGNRLQATTPGADGTPQAAGPGLADPVQRLHLALRLANSSGALGLRQLEQLRLVVEGFAASAGAQVEAPEPEPYAEAAQDLDAFLAEADVQVGLNVMAALGRPFPGTKVRGIAEAAGFSLDGQGGMRYRDDTGAVLFRLVSESGEALAAETMSKLSLNGITLLLDVPQVADGQRAFERMVSTGKHLAHALGGVMVDDNHKPVTEAGFEQIRAQLRRIYAMMQARGVRAGSPQAQRLFG